MTNAPKSADRYVAPIRKRGPLQWRRPLHLLVTQIVEGPTLFEVIATKPPEGTFTQVTMRRADTVGGSKTRLRAPMSQEMQSQVQTHPIWNAFVDYARTTLDAVSLVVRRNGRHDAMDVHVLPSAPLTVKVEGQDEPVLPIRMVIPAVDTVLAVIREQRANQQA